MTSRSRFKLTTMRSMTHSRHKPSWVAGCAGAVQWLAIIASLALGPPLRAIAGTIPANDAVVLAVLPTALAQQREFSRSNEPRDVGATLQLVRLYLDADADSGDAR
jgi:hypothetical protein